MTFPARVSFFAILAFFCFFSFANAAPVKFSYASNAITEPDIEIYASGWRKAYLDQFLGDNYPEQAVGFQAKIEIETDCLESNSVWTCEDVFVLGVKQNMLFPGPVLAASGFRDAIFSIGLTVGSNGQPDGWFARGSEVFGSGDFELRDTGDKWIWPGSQSGDFGAGIFYCNYTYGFHPNHTDTTCANGEPAELFGHEIDLGVGIWTVDASQLLTVPVPLLGGMPFFLSGLGMLALHRRNRLTSS